MIWAIASGPHGPHGLPGQLDGHLAAVEQAAVVFDGLAHEIDEVQAGALQADLAAAYPGDVEQVVDQTRSWLS